MFDIDAQFRQFQRNFAIESTPARRRRDPREAEVHLRELERNRREFAHPSHGAGEPEGRGFERLADAPVLELDTVAGRKIAEHARKLRATHPDLSLSELIEGGWRANPDLYALHVDELRTRARVLLEAPPVDHLIPGDALRDRIEEDVVTLRAGGSVGDLRAKPMYPNTADQQKQAEAEAETVRRAKQLRAKNPKLSEEECLAKVFRDDPKLRAAVNASPPLEKTIVYPATPYKGRKGDDGQAA